LTDDLIEERAMPDVISLEAPSAVIAPRPAVNGEERAGDAAMDGDGMVNAAPSH
jgi:hypothetical protein